MSSSADGRKHGDLPGQRTFRAGWGCRGAYLTCLLALIGLSWIASEAIAENGERSGISPLLKPVIEFWSGKSDRPAVPVDDDSQRKAEKPAPAKRLVMETEKPEAYEQLVAQSPYPPTESPDKLTLEQLEAIAKLAPKANKAGLQAHPAMVPLFRSMVLRYTGGTYKNAPIRFRLHTPERCEEGKKYPMVVWLHGAGECGSDNLDQLSHLHHIIPSLVGPKKRDFFLLVPQCPHFHTSWEAPEICATKVRADGTIECHLTDNPVALESAPLAFTLAMIEAVMKEFPVDSNRVTVAGLSTGGEGVWRILERRPDLFAAAVPVVSWQAMHESSLRDKPLLKKIPIWAIYSSDDKGIDFARKEFERMRDLGCRVWKTEFGVCGHRAWTPAMLQGDVFGWLISRAKDGDRYHAAEPSATSPEAIGIFADVTDGDLQRRPTRAPAKPKQPVAAEQPTAPPQVQAPVVEATVAKPARVNVDPLRIDLVRRYIARGDLPKAKAVADKVQNRRELVTALLGMDLPPEMLDYVDRELDRLEQQGDISGAARSYRVPSEAPALSHKAQPPRPKQERLEPIPAGKKSPKDECGKEWAMSPTTLYGLFPHGWDQESNYVPGYVLNETGRQLRDRLSKAFSDNDLAAMKELCDSFIRLDDIPLSSPWFDTSGGRLHARIKYTLNDKARPVVDLLRDIARVKAESKREFAELAQKSLDRIDAITHPKSDK